MCLSGYRPRPPGESTRIVEHFQGHGFAALDLTHDDMAKEHLRHMVGGASALAQDERLLRFVFPEQPGALLEFLSLMAPNWNISLFHYRNQGADYRAHFGGPASARQGWGAVCPVLAKPGLPLGGGNPAIRPTNYSCANF